LKQSLKAAKWYRKAANQGEAKSQFTLGMIYEKGKGVKKDVAEAAKWYGKAAKQGNADAVHKLHKLKKSGFLQ
jgi:TPR repeat protein